MHSKWPYGYTAEEMAEAEKRYQAMCKDMYDRDYAGDFGCGLQFAMETYCYEYWKPLFDRPPPNE